MPPAPAAGREGTRRGATDGWRGSGPLPPPPDATKTDQKKEAPRRPGVAVAALEKGVGDGEILTVERASLLDMALVSPSLGRDVLHGKGHLRAGAGAEG